MAKGRATWKNKSEGRFRNPHFKDKSKRPRIKFFLAITGGAILIFALLYPGFHITTLDFAYESDLFEISKVENSALTYPLTTHILYPVAGRVRRVAEDEGLGDILEINRTFSNISVTIKEPDHYVYVHNEEWQSIGLPHFTTQPIPKEALGDILGALSAGAPFVQNERPQIVLEQFDANEQSIQLGVSIWNQIADAGVSPVMLIQEDGWIRARTSSGIDLYLTEDPIDVLALRSIWKTRDTNEISAYIDLRFDGRAYTK
jgi:hypothetical protein